MRRFRSWFRVWRFMRYMRKHEVRIISSNGPRDDKMSS